MNRSECTKETIASLTPVPTPYPIVAAIKHVGHLIKDYDSLTRYRYAKRQLLFGWFCLG
jgi:hypothetical protein